MKGLIGLIEALRAIQTDIYDAAFRDTIRKNYGYTNWTYDFAIEQDPATHRVVEIVHRIRLS